MYGRPLRTAREVLVQAMTEEKPYGYRVEDDRVVDLGGYPMLVREIRTDVTIRGGARLSEAVVLDVHGYERGKAKLRRRGRDAVLTLPKDALYTILR
jgi:hypothetical protein